LLSNLHLIGWPALIFAAYRIIVVCVKVGRAAAKVEQRVLDGEKTLYLMATNHLPHIQEAMEDNTKELRGLREDLKLLFLKD